MVGFPYTGGEHLIIRLSPGEAEPQLSALLPVAEGEPLSVEQVQRILAWDSYNMHCTGTDHSRRADRLLTARARKLLPKEDRPGRGPGARPGAPTKPFEPHWPPLPVGELRTPGRSSQLYLAPRPGISGSGRGIAEQTANSRKKAAPSA